MSTCSSLIAPLAVSAVSDKRNKVPVGVLKGKGLMKGIYYINGNECQLIQEESVLMIDEKPFPTNQYYFIQIKDAETIADNKLAAGTIIFQVCIEGQSAHKFLAENVLHLNASKLNSGGEFFINDNGNFMKWLVKTCSYYEVLGLDKDPDVPKRVGLPKATFQEVFKEVPQPDVITPSDVR